MKSFPFILGIVALSACSTPGARTPTAPSTQHAQITLTSPMDWQVFQRTSKAEGRVSIEGHFNNDAGIPLRLVVSVQMGKLGKLPYPAYEGDVLKAITEKDGIFRADTTIPEGGWHQLTIEILDGDGLPLDSLVINHVGVGEVFVVGGQSNSTNYGEGKTKSESGYVTVFDGEKCTLAEDPIPGVDGVRGSPWCHFGDMMTEHYHVPIGIVPVGKGSTSVRQWLPAGETVDIEPTRTYGMKKNDAGKWESTGTLYDRMVQRMKQLGPNGFRAMLWHQGESDAHQEAGHTLPGADYRRYLEHIITQSRKEVGWDVPWFVAQATWAKPESPEDPDIRAAQQAIWNDHIALPGPDTDKLLGENREKNGTRVHFSEKGLKAHAEAWMDVVGKWLDQQAK